MDLWILVLRCGCGSDGTHIYHAEELLKHQEKPEDNQKYQLL